MARRAGGRKPRPRYEWLEVSRLPSVKRPAGPTYWSVVAPGGQPFRPAILAQFFTVEGLEQWTTTHHPGVPLRWREPRP